MSIYTVHMTQRVIMLEKLLRDLEWIPNVCPDKSIRDFCPVCDSCRDDEGHAENCRLAKALEAPSE